jgi:hypothetical protein
MTLVELRTEVDKIVYEMLPASLLEAGIKRHVKHGFKTNCVCDYCTAKRYYSYTFLRNSGMHYNKQNKEYIRQKLKQVENYVNTI